MTTQFPNPSKEEDTTPTATSARPTPPTSRLIPLPHANQQPPLLPPRQRKRVRASKARPFPILLMGLVWMLLLLVIGLAVLIVYAPNAFDPYIHGRLHTRTQQAQIILQTESALQAQAESLRNEQTQSALALLSTATALQYANEYRATEHALSVLHTAVALQQTATYGAFSLDATRTVAAMQAQFIGATATANAFNFSLTQTQVARPTLAPIWLPTASADQIIIPLAETVLYADSFDNGLASFWIPRGTWATADGKAYSTICGTDITVSVPSRSRFAVEFTAENRAAQYAVQMRYGDQTHVWVNFGLGGAVWWLSDSALTVTDETLPNAYDAARSNRIRVEVRDRVVSVFINGSPLIAREFSQSITSPIGIYTCPTADGIPLFDDFTLFALP